MKPVRRKGVRKISSLTRREQELVRLVGNGLRNREIAHKLDVAVGSVTRDLRDVFRKLGVSSRIELIMQAHSRATSANPTGRSNSVSRD